MKRHVFSLFVLLAGIAACDSDDSEPKQKMPLSAADVEVVTVAHNSVTLKWRNRSTNADSIEIVIWPAESNVTFERVVARVAATEEQAVVSGLEQDLLYFGSVKPYNEAGGVITTVVNFETTMPWGTYEGANFQHEQFVGSAGPFGTLMYVNLTNSLDATDFGETGTAVLEAAGTGSGLREALAMEMLELITDATLTHTFSEISYTGDGQKFDLMVSIQDKSVSVNVTSASGSRTETEAREFLLTQLQVMRAAEDNVAESHKPDLLMLIVYVDSSEAFDTFLDVWAGEGWENTITVLTLTEGTDSGIF